MRFHKNTHFNIIRLIFNIYFKKIYYGKLVLAISNTKQNYSIDEKKIYLWQVVTKPIFAILFFYLKLQHVPNCSFPWLGVMHYAYRTGVYYIILQIDSPVIA